MPNFTNTRDIIVDNYLNPMTRQKAVVLRGKPGCGKTHMGYAIADAIGIPPERVIITHPARRNPINYMGLPDVRGDKMVWIEPEELHTLSEGPAVFVIDEVGQCSPIMSNTVGSFLHDRGINKIKLHDDVCVIATTNNAEDRAGSKELLTHLGNRGMLLDVEYTKDDFIPYGIERGLDPIGLAYLEYRPQHMFDFDPARPINATARSWEYALQVNPNQPAANYIAALSGILPEGIAMEYIGFRKVADRMPDPQECRAHPTSVDVPTEAQVQYALVSNFIVTTNDGDTFERTMRYMLRMSLEMQTLYISHVLKRVPEANDSPVYTKWLAENAGAFGGA
jgi:hypothetical protein